MTEETYPQHEKLHEVKEDSQTIGLFLSWFFGQFDVYPKGSVGRIVELAEEAGVFRAIAGVEEPEVPLRVLGTDTLFNRTLADYYNIDYDELMAEKDRILEAFRERTAA